MNTDKVLRQIVKLLELAKSGNVNEAAAAAAQAQELMLKHKIEEADVTAQAGGANRPPEEVVDIVMDEGEGKKRADWRHTLASTLSQFFNVETYRWTGSDKVHAIGRPSDIQTVSYLLGYLALEIERLCTAEWRKLIGEYQAGEYGVLSPPRVQPWKTLFRDGAMTAIQRKLKQQRADMEARLQSSANTNVALVKVKADEALVKREIEAVKKKISSSWRTGKSAPRRGPRSAYDAGVAAGASITIGEARGALPEAKKRLT